MPNKDDEQIKRTMLTATKQFNWISQFNDRSMTELEMRMVSQQKSTLFLIFSHFSVRYWRSIIQDRERRLGSTCEIRTMPNRFLQPIVQCIQLTSLWFFCFSMTQFALACVFSYVSEGDSHRQRLDRLRGDIQSHNMYQIFSFFFVFFLSMFQQTNLSCKISGTSVRTTGAIRRIGRRRSARSSRFPLSRRQSCNK